MLTGDLIVVFAISLLQELVLLLPSATGSSAHLFCLLLMRLMTGLEWLQGTRHIIIAIDIRGKVIISVVRVPLSLSLPLALSVWAERHALLELKLLLLVLLCHHCSIHGSQVRVHLLLILHLLLLLQVWRDGPKASSSRKEASSSSRSSRSCGGRGWQQPLRLRWYQPISPARGNCTNFAAVANTAAATAVIAIATITTAACGVACGGGGVSRWALSLDRPFASYCGGSLNRRTATTTCYHFRSCWWCRRYLTNSSRRRRHVQLHLRLHLHGEVRGWVERHR